MPNLDHILFPVIDPYDHDWLRVSATHEIYYEQCGNPHGQPVVVLHGGPGSGCNPGQRRFFDPAHYRIILFDQRGCNRSRPPGCIEDNTIWHLVEDIEALRMHLGIETWLVFGGSWGSTLALAYAARHLAAVQGLILRGIFLCREQELVWFLQQARYFFPEAWLKLASLPGLEPGADLMTCYHQQIFGTDAQRALAAAERWNAYEGEIMSLLPTPGPSFRPEPAAIMARARVLLHYLVNQGFLAEQPLLEQVECLRHIPAVIIQGRYDMVCPPITAHELHQRWPEADFRIVPDAGHSSMEPGVAAALVEATNRFRQLA